MTSLSPFLYEAPMTSYFARFKRERQLPGRRAGRDVTRKAAGRNSIFAFRLLLFFYARAAKQSRFRRARQKSRLQLRNKGHNKKQKVVFKCGIKVNKNEVTLKVDLKYWF